MHMYFRSGRKCSLAARWRDRHIYIGSKSIIKVLWKPHRYVTEGDDCWVLLLSSLVYQKCQCCSVEGLASV